jgi:hypothetical protein
VEELADQKTSTEQQSFLCRTPPSLAQAKRFTLMEVGKYQKDNIEYLKPKNNESSHWN